ncbi:MAG: hypothetical protein ACMXX5_00955 [Candidatus Woesearchaeota archaeon]
MKKLKLFTIIIGCMILLNLSGCFSPPGVTYIDFRSGREGLRLSILGPNEMKLYPGQETTYEEFEFIVENRGASNLENNDIYMRIQMTDNFLVKKDTDIGRITLRSLDEFNNMRITSLEGKSSYRRTGDQISHFLNTEATPPPQKYTTANIRADLCYRYKTILSDSICINTVKHLPGKGCSRTRYTYNQGQGAPIRITSIEIREIYTQDDEIQTNIVLEIENVEGNIVSLPDGSNFIEGCLSRHNINHIKIESATLGNNQLKCTEDDDDIIELIDNKRNIVCTLQGSHPDISEGHYDTTLYIELAYGYHTSAVKRVNIVREDY